MMEDIYNIDMDQLGCTCATPEMFYGMALVLLTVFVALPLFLLSGILFLFKRKNKNKKVYKYIFIGFSLLLILFIVSFFIVGTIDFGCEGCNY